MGNNKPKKIFALPAMKEKKNLINLKILITISLTIFLYGKIKSASCHSELMCEGCNKNGGCTSCFSSGISIWVKPKVLNNDNAADTGRNCHYDRTVGLDENCALYDGAENVNSAVSPTTCMRCYPGFYKKLRYSKTSTSDAGGTWTSSCEKVVDKAVDEIDNCVPGGSVKIQTANGAPSESKYCSLCLPGFRTDLEDANKMGPTSCVGGTHFAKCQNSFRSGNGVTVTGGCWSCEKGYALRFDLGQCIPYPKDVNCRVLDHDHSSCARCFPWFYFDSGICKFKG